MSEIERRLRADADRQPDVQPEDLSIALGVARGARPGRRRHYLMSTAVAASVVLVAGLAAALTGKFGGGHGPAGGSSDSSGAPVVEIHGVVVNRRNPKQLHVDFGPVAGSNACLDARDAAKVVQQSAAAIRIEIVTGGPDSVSPSDHVGVTGTGGPYTDTAEVPSGVPSGVPSASNTPGGGPYTDTGSVPSATGSASEASGSDVGATGTYAPLPTSLTGAEATPVCTKPAIESIVTLAAAPGDRPIFVNGERAYLMQTNYPATFGYVPAGYDQNPSVSINPADPRDASTTVLDGSGVDVLTISYGQPGALVADGAVTAHADVNGAPAAITESSWRREVTWTLPTGAVLQVSSFTQPRAANTPAPLTAATLLRVARSLH